MTAHHYFSQALDLKSKQPIYTEEYQETHTHGHLKEITIRYRDESEELIATKVLTFGSQLSAPNFHLQDLRDGYEEGAEVLEKGIRLFYRKHRGEPLKEKILKVPAPAVIDMGFHHFILNHWEELTRGKSLIVHVAVPYQLNHFEFRVRQTKELEYAGHPALNFKLEINQFLLRQLLSPITVTYGRENRRLLVYEGISNLNDPNGHSYTTLTTFRY